MSEYLTDTNVGNIGYIKKQKAIDILKQRKREPWYLHKDLDWDNGVAEAISDIEYIEPDNVVPYLLYPDGSLSIRIPEDMTVTSVFIHQGRRILCGMNLLPNRMR